MLWFQFLFQHHLIVVYGICLRRAESLRRHLDTTVAPARPYGLVRGLPQISAVAGQFCCSKLR